MAEYKLGVIGAGNMAEALVRGAIVGSFLSPGRIVVCDPLPQRRKLFSSELGVSAEQDNAVAAACPHVLLAVKPQMMAEMLESIAQAVRNDSLVVSIAAGVKTSFIDEKLNHHGRIVRVMPNTPMLVGEGVSAVAAGPRATEQDVQWASSLVSASGQAVVVDEAMMDAVTAVSGSGPAYFFYLIEAMIAAGEAEGLDADTAALLAAQTCVGAGKLLLETGETPQELRKRVTSPSGTTQRAVETMDAAGVKDSLIRAIRAAAERSRQLAK